MEAKNVQQIGKDAALKEFMGFFEKVPTLFDNRAPETVYFIMHYHDLILSMLITAYKGLDYDDAKIKELLIKSINKAKSYSETMGVRVE